MKESIEDAEYDYVIALNDTEHLLFDKVVKKYEIWFNNPNHASYGILYKELDLEFARSIKNDEAAELTGIAVWKQVEKNSN